MITAKNVFIGFGKAAKTLAGALASRGESVIMIEASDKMYGGTCINVACIPTKTLLTSSQNNQLGNAQENYTHAIVNKNDVTGTLRESNLHKIADKSTVTVLNGRAEFEAPKQLKVTYQNGKTDEISGDHIFINTGSTPILPDVPGLQQSTFVKTSESLMDQRHLPKHLVIIGGGYIGLEFASIYANFGSQVTIIDAGKKFMPRDERELAQEVKKNLAEKNVRFEFNAQIAKIEDNDGFAQISFTQGDQARTIDADTILVATGRKANIANLGLDKAGIETNNHGVVVNDHLQTNVKDIWAMGDVRGGAQFTYISLDDYRIVLDQLVGDGKRSLKEQSLVPHVVFLDTPVATIGMNEEQAKEENVAYLSGKIMTASVPKAHVIGNTTGYLKVLVSPDSHEILGATLYCVDAQELINTISLAMHQHIPYEVLRDQIYSHPTMTEAFNDLFGAVK
ncbi:FAD-dependent oxidoreductase [Pediococcus inopinatus]|uniref:FAD-dependent oxidoreductase n=1 Tax=Pediococcus inopinatus TaxID=114090 RepID=A0ABZ0Q5A6_9LACO|nr:FAD-dependent oxidoreductase [Pediococcus inopinatus]AVK99385.1 pyridine nucleotide-disulfide oxidoreductase [Pediococcus inopinatus]KRN61043.1 pyruvate 2-oxoglutarate dehydrogenase complex, dihydrolipoamide dehydrogenase (E3) component [Pediococcus inopinatus]WPC17158.1 FAD-dependent oxidoreductase [Pediococcus inopinatus]WPC22132.1 FAD-dependent oxidoreductase [Pediococcus inopinatus]WPP08934.1 FAD-dependent oxidoreductase [Pediococcus inopinatus]